jgi:hypothetical protein
MKYFIYRSALWICFVLFLYSIAILIFADGYFDAYYRRFSTSQKGSLILGTSRAAQGIHPEVLSRELDINHDDILNFSFNVGASPYGNLYNHAIFKKLSRSHSNSYFFLCVDPWSIASKKNVEEVFEARENALELGRIENYNSQFGVNLDYLFNNYGFAWGNNIISKSLKSRLIEFLITNREIIPKMFEGLMPNGFSYLHDDGWLEVTLIDTTETFLRQRNDKKVRAYQLDYDNQYFLSCARLNALNELIDTLSTYGTVYMVRMPINEEIFILENDNFPEFDSIMKKTAIEKNIKYFDFTYKNAEFKYTDGNHLLKTSAKAFTKELSITIKNEK